MDHPHTEQQTEHRDYRQETKTGQEIEKGREGANLYITKETRNEKLDSRQGIKMVVLQDTDIQGVVQFRLRHNW